MLFLPTQAPVHLPPEGLVLIGRTSEADLQLHDADTSRRHAEIVCRPDGFTIHDLGSTNGTWVNGRRVEDHALQPGDRIGIGDSLIAFCQVSAGIEGSASDTAATASLKSWTWTKSRRPRSTRSCRASATR